MITKGGTVLLAGYLALLGWGRMGPKQPELATGLQRAADEVVLVVVEDLRLHRGEAAPVMLLAFGGDPSEYFTHQLHQLARE